MQTQFKTIAVRCAAFLAAIPLVGCSATQLRTGGDVLGAAGGGAIASKLSHGNPLITAAGAGGGALLADVAGSQIQKGQDSAEKAGYQRGQADAAKQLYWAQQALQKRQDGDEQGQVSLYEVPCPRPPSKGPSSRPEPEPSASKNSLLLTP